MTYDRYWLGLDRGREGLLDPDVWRGVLEVLSRHEGESIRDAEAPLYEELRSRFPETEWISAHDQEHNFFRDYQTSWTLAGVLVPTRDTNGLVRLTDVGRDLVERRVSLRAAWLSAMAAHTEGGEKPFAILAAAFLELGARSLTLAEIYFGIERGWRPGDGPVAAVLGAVDSSGSIAPTPARRLRQILKLMTVHGVLVARNEGWAAGDAELLVALASGEPLVASSGRLSDQVHSSADQEVSQLPDVEFDLPVPLREVVMKAIAVRRGQPQFRRLLLGLYSGRCAISGYDGEAALEAAHIVPISETGDHSARNGLLLRADLHTLFDLHYVGIDPSDWTVALCPILESTRYGALNGETVRLPIAVADRPSARLLAEHLAQVRTGG